MQTIKTQRSNDGSEIPLTPVAFEVLLAVADDEIHGYAIMRAVEERTAGAMSLHPGTLYRAIGRLVQEELLEELPERPVPEDHDQRRRAYFRITPKGRRAARAESERLASQVSAARQRRFLEEG